MMMPIVSAKGIGMTYNISHQREQRLKEYFINILKGKLAFEEFIALSNVSFTLYKGDSLGIIGKNGSGKSTVLKLICGILKPTLGEVCTFGSIAPLIEMGGGFDREMTAKENIYLVGSMHGHSRSFIKQRLNAIIDFSELHDFVDIPLKNFSSGMIARLGFAIATLVEADILIADEVLSVGDMAFRQKCEGRINEMVNSGTTVLFVSHSMQQVCRICRQTLWLHKGKVVQIGESEAVCNAYSVWVAGGEKGELFVE